MFTLYEPKKFPLLNPTLDSVLYELQQPDFDKHRFDYNEAYNKLLGFIEKGTNFNKFVKNKYKPLSVEDQQFFIGIIKGDLAVVNKLKTANRINLQINNGLTAIHLAALIKDRLEILKTLLTFKGVKIQPDAYQLTPIIYAATLNYHDVLTILINTYPASISDKNREGYNVLHLAAYYKYPKVVETIKDKGQVKNIVNDFVGTHHVLHLAISENTQRENYEQCHKVVSLLLQLPDIFISVKNADQKTCYHIACEKNLSDIQKCFEFYFYCAAIEGDIAKLKDYINVSLVSNCRLPKEEISNVNLLASGNTVLHGAISAGQIEAAKILIEAGADPAFLNELKLNILHGAVLSGNPKAVEYILETTKGIDFNVQHSAYDDKVFWLNGRKPLEVAFDHLGVSIVAHSQIQPYLIENKTTNDEAVEIIQKLIKYNYLLEPNHKKNSFTSAEQQFFMSIIDEDIHLFEKQLKQVNVNLQLSNGFTALHLIILIKGRMQFLKKILECKDIQLLKDVKGLTAVHYAAILGYGNVISSLARKFPTGCSTIDDEGYTVLALAIIYEHPQFINNLAFNRVKGIDPNERGTYVDSQGDFVAYDFTPLHIATYKNNIAAIEALTKFSNIDINARAKSVAFTDSTALHCAAIRSQSEIVEILLTHLSVDANALAEEEVSYFGKPNKIKQGTALHFVIKYQYHESTLLALLKSNKVNINAVATLLNDSDQLHTGVTALHLAAMVGNLEAINYLIEYGALTNLKDSNQLMPVDYAGVNQDLWQRLQNVPNTLHEAVTVNDVARLKVLYEKDQLVDSKDDNDRTPLYIAAQNGNLNIVKILLQLGAIPTKVILEVATVEVKNFFNYRPSKKNINLPTIYQYAEQKDKSADKLRRIILDQEDTSDEDSEEEIGNNYVQDIQKKQELINIESKPEFKELKEEAINEYNSSKRTEKAESLKILLTRGFHWTPMHFKNAAARKKHAEFNEIGSATLSTATFNKASCQFNNLYDEENPAVKEADDQIKKKFDDLRRAEDKEEKGVNRTAPKNGFTCLFNRFIQAYVETYNRLFDQKLLSKHYGFDNNDNPVVSTSYLEDKATYYASGSRINEDKQKKRLHPHYRRSTGKPKHPNLGVLYAYVMDLEYLFAKGIFILDLIQQKKIGIGHVKQFEGEIFFESLIPKQYLKHRRVFTVPSFEKEWTSEFEHKYGLTKRQFNDYKNRIANMPVGKWSKEVLDVIDKIIEVRIPDFGQKIRMEAQLALYQDLKLSKFLIYPFATQCIRSTPALPKDKDKWEDQSPVQSPYKPPSTNIEELTESVRTIALDAEQMQMEVKNFIPDKLNLDESEDNQSIYQQLIADKIVELDELKMWEGKLPDGQTIILQNYKTKGDGNCAIHVLPVRNRQEIVNILLPLINNVETRKELAFEIEAVFKENGLKNAANAATMAFYNEYLQFSDCYQWVDNLATAINIKLEQRGYKRLDHAELYNGLVQNKFNVIDSDVESYIQFYKAVCDFDEKLKAYFTTSEMCSRYINLYLGDSGWLGYKTILLIAKHKHFPVYLWGATNKDSQTLTLLDYHEEQNPADGQIIHFFHTSGFTHFELMSALTNQEKKLVHNQNIRKLIH